MLPFSSCKTPSLLRLFYERHKRCSVVWTGTSCIVHSFVLINELCAKSGWFTLFFRHPSCCGVGIYEVGIVWYMEENVTRVSDTFHNCPVSKAPGFLLIGGFSYTNEKTVHWQALFVRQEATCSWTSIPSPLSYTALFWPGFSLRKESNAKTSELLEEVENWKQKHLGQWRDTWEQWKKEPFSLSLSLSLSIALLISGIFVMLAYQ